MADTGLCKKVKIRFTNAMKLVDPKDVAATIISAQRRGLEEVTVPRYLFYLNTFLRVFPSKCTDLVKDFFNSGVESDM
jgi:all-trans-retinol dehydrogenase (NAD+)